MAVKGEANHIWQIFFRVAAGHNGAVAASAWPGGSVMKSPTSGSRTAACRGTIMFNMTVVLALLIALATTGFARAEIATPEQKKACTPDVYRLCAGEIPNVRAITACLRRQRTNLSDAGRAVFEQ
jgi:hypothetical protein